MKWMITLAFASILVSACAPSVPYTVKEPIKAGTPVPETDKATVIFVRPDFYAWDVPYVLYGDGKPIAVVKGLKECAITRLTEGKHLLAVNAMRKTGLAGAGSRDHYYFMDADLAKGKLYYVYVRPYGIFGVGFLSDLEPVRVNQLHWDNLPDWLNECTLTEITSETLQWDSSYALEHKSERDGDYSEWLKDESRSSKALKPEDGLTEPVIPKVSSVKN